MEGKFVKPSVIFVMGGKSIHRKFYWLKDQEQGKEHNVRSSRMLMALVFAQQENYCEKKFIESFSSKFLR